MITDNKYTIDIINSISSILNLPHNDVANVLQLYSVLLKSKIYDNSIINEDKVSNKLSVKLLDIGNIEVGKTNSNHLHIYLNLSREEYTSILLAYYNKVNPLLDYLNNKLPSVYDKCKVKNGGDLLD